MNEMQKMRDYVVGYFQSHPLVNTVTTLTPDLIDTNHDTIYPLVNADVTWVSNLNDVVVFSAKIHVLDQLDEYTRSTDNKQLLNTNSNDIDNEMSSLCNDFINSFRKYNAADVELLSASDATPIRKEYQNVLNGFTFTATLSIPNEGSACS